MIPKTLIKEKLARSEIVYIVKVSYQDPALYELVGKIGFDGIWICNEHISIDRSKLDGMVRVCRISGTDAIIRTSPGSYRDLIQPLEIGAQGLMLPRIRNVGEVKEIIKNCKFPPEGERGIDGISVDADFGLRPLKDYISMANDNTFIIIQIETLEILKHIEEIAAIKGVDVLFVGPADLSLSMGISGEINHPEILKICRKVGKVCRKYKKTAGIPYVNDEDFKRFRDMGFNFFCGTTDFRIVKNGFLQAKKNAEALGVKFSQPH